MSTEQTANASLVGTWRLIRWTGQAEGAIVHPFGEGASGRLIYDAGGTMAAFLQCPEWSASAVDFVPQRSRFIAYSGKYTIAGNNVLHHVDTASDPRWIGTDLVRCFSITGGTLTIETRPTSTYGIGRFHHDLQWQ